MNIAQIKSVLASPSISWKAKGIYAFLAENPSLFDLVRRDLIKHLWGNGIEGRAAVASAIEELERAGLLTLKRFQRRCPTHNQDGKPGFVYLMKEVESGLYKIGSSINPKDRVRSVAHERGATIKLLKAFPCQDMGFTERSLHKKYDYYRREGEMFELPTWEADAILKQEVA